MPGSVPDANDIANKQDLGEHLVIKLKTEECSCYIKLYRCDKC